MATILLAARDLPPLAQGDPVAVQDDPATWGTKELLPPLDGGNFVRVQIVDVTAAQVERRLRPLLVDAVPGVDPEADAPDPADRRVRRARRLWRVIVSELPGGVRSQLNREGFYSTDLATVKQFVRRKVWNGGAVEDGPTSEFDEPEP